MTNKVVCALVAAAFAFAVASTSSAGDLQWQRGRTPKAAARQSKYQRHRDSGVRPAAFEEEGVGPRLTSADEGRAAFRSIVVNHGEGNDVRTAQRPGYTEQPGAPATDNLEEKITIPFGEPPEATPPAETPGMEATPEPPALPETNDDSLAPPAMRQRRPGEPAPSTFRPLPAPERGATERAPTDSRLQQEIVPDVTPQTPEPGANEESCDESWSKLKAKTIGMVDLSIQVTGKEGEDFPYECAIQDSGLIGRCWAQTTYLWKASALCHKPLYFEDEQLERYGHSMPPCIQPFCSGAHFFCTLPVLPYCMGVEPPTECIYALGHYRPGSCAPYMFEPVPLSWRGALFEAGAWTGAAFVIP